MNLPEWIANVFGEQKKSDRRNVRLNVENMEDRIVPSTTSILYDLSTDGGVAGSGHNRTPTIGQTLVVDVAASVDGSPDPASPTPTGTVTFSLYNETTSVTYTIASVALQAGPPGVGEAELTTSDLPTSIRPLM
jgi:hypothetical protein